MWLDSIGWSQSNVEIALDFVGWLFDADDHKSFVTKLEKYPISQGEVCQSINFGFRSKNPSSGSLYAKGLLLDVLRGDPPAGYIERLREAGWDSEQFLTRLELRMRGKALVLVDPKTGEVFDNRKPWTACDRAAIGRLASHSLQSTWLADRRRGHAAQTRDNPVHPGWLVAREAARGGAEPIRLSRAVATAQLGAVRNHARARLLRGAIDVGVLERAGDVGRRAR